MEPNDLVNHGIILRPGHPSQDEPRTFIISGMARSGTTMVATMLLEAGIYLGRLLSPLVNEDREFLAAMADYDVPRIDDLIAERNAMGVDWGFKVPHIGAYVGPELLERFRNPHLILAFRDPIAITMRHAIADYVDPLSALEDIAEAISGLTKFVRKTTCPAFLFSYEKALLFPSVFVDALTEFCTLPTDTVLRQHMIGLVEPNAPAYIQVARRQYDGRIESYRDGVLYGWCCHVGLQEPVPLDLFVNGNMVLTFLADAPRPDLAQAGYGDGRHGFAIRLNAPPETHVRIQLNGRTIDLDNSGRRLSEYLSIGTP